MGKVLIIGGGIIGLSSAFYLKRSGWDVTVLDKGDFTDNCSYGNCGYICPSHFIPLGYTGYCKTGIEMDVEFQKSFLCAATIGLEPDQLGIEIHAQCHKKHVETAAVPLRDIAIISQKEYESG